MKSKKVTETVPLSKKGLLTRAMKQFTVVWIFIVLAIWTLFIITAVAADNLKELPGGLLTTLLCFFVGWIAIMLISLNGLRKLSHQEKVLSTQYKSACRHAQYQKCGRNGIVWSSSTIFICISGVYINVVFAGWVDQVISSNRFINQHDVTVLTREKKKMTFSFLNVDQKDSFVSWCENKETVK